MKGVKQAMRPVVREIAELMVDKIVPAVEMMVKKELARLLGIEAAPLLKVKLKKQKVGRQRCKVCGSAGHNARYHKKAKKE